MSNPSAWSMVPRYLNDGVPVVEHDEQRLEAELESVSLDDGLWCGDGNL